MARFAEDKLSLLALLEQKMALQEDSKDVLNDIVPILAEPLIS